MAVDLDLSGDDDDDEVLPMTATPGKVAQMLGTHSFIFRDSGQKFGRASEELGKILHIDRISATRLC